jgi:hypothetical protein
MIVSHKKQEFPPSINLKDTVFDGWCLYENKE